MEQEKTVKALRTAIQMEIDGKKYYLKTGRESSNEAGRKLLASLAAEEDIHRKKFEEIFAAIQKKKGWPAVAFKPDGGKGLRTVFAEATREAGTKVKALATELDSVKMAMDMENHTYDFYVTQGKDASAPAEGEFYAALSAQERQHYLVLLDYYEYLKDPAGWFVVKERHSLDGG